MNEGRVRDTVLPRPAIGVLGEVLVRDADGHEAPLSPQRREILAIIAAHAGAVVPQHRLLESLWGRDDDRTRASLKQQVHTIRKSLDRGLTIENHNGGYRLKGPLDLLDSTRFEQLVAQARELPAHEAARQYALALEQWRGTLPFADVDNDLVNATAWRLQALRDDVVVQLADAEIASRVGSSSLPMLESMFADDPTRGDLALRLAKLYALTGRQLEGTRALAAHRDALAEVGAIVAPDVQALESQILRHELRVLPPVDRLAVTPALLPRDAWVDRVVGALASQPVLLIGDPGVGKSTLTRLVEQRLAAKHIRVVRASVLEDPFRPMDVIATVVEQLREVLPQSTARALRSKRLVHACTRLMGGPDAAQVPATTRDELLDDLTDLISTSLRGTGAVLVIEDLQWLDASSAEILVGLLERSGIHLLATSRAPTHPLLDEPPRTLVLHLPAFDQHEVDELLRLALPLRATDDLTRSLHEQTGGNALFLGLLLDVLGRGELGAEVPLTLQAAVAERTAALARTTRELLQLASLLGRSFPVQPLRQLRRRAGEQLVNAEEDGLVQLELGPVPGSHDHGPTTGHFVHGLVADALAAMVPSGSRVSWHDELCRALIACRFSAVAVAPQAVGAADLDPIRAADACRDAATEHAALFEWQLVADWARRGLDVVERFHMTGQRIEGELRSLLGTALRRTNRPGSDLELLRAADLASEYEDDPLLVATVTELCLHGFTSTVGDVDDRARRHLDYALSLDLAAPQRTELLAAAATLFASSPEADLGRSLYHEARDVAIRSENERLVRTVLMNAHLGLAHPDDLGLRWHAADTLAGFDDVEARWEAAFLHANLALVAADRHLFDDSVSRIRELTPQVRRRSRARSLMQVDAVDAFVRGDLAAAEQLANHSLEAGLAGYSESWALAIYAALLIPVRQAQGRLGELWPLVEERMRLQPAFTSWHALAAPMADARGDHATAHELLALLRERKLDLVEDTTYTAVSSMLAIPVWRAADHELATVLYERLSPYEGQMSWNGLSTHGPIDAALALLADVLGDRDAALRHKTLARQLVARIDAPHLWWPVLDELPYD
ncbi:MAG: AAA family ATPase [Acidimicrobiales bacterium]